MPILPRNAAAHSYPGRPVRLVVGLAPGGATDIIARLIGEWLSAHIGQSVVIENRPGAAGSVAAEMVLRSPADGYTLFVGSDSSLHAAMVACCGRVLTEAQPAHLRKPRSRAASRA